jgi:uncharacterized protein
MENLNTNPAVRKSLVVLLAILIVFAAVKTISELKGLSYIGKSTVMQNVINVTGKGEVVTTPDIATFSFGVSEEDLVVSNAQKAANDKMAKIIDYLKTNGVDAKDIKTVAYDIYPRYDYQQRTYKQVLAGYMVSQTIQVKVRKMEDAGKLLSGIGEFGATNVSGLTFTVDSQDELAREARDKAIADAREQAEKLAKSLGVRLGKMTSFYESTPYQPYPMYYSRDLAMNGGGMVENQAATIPGGESKITSTVTITYEIK